MIIGLTGGIASGKSSVTRYLLKQGYQVIDADKIAHDALTIDQDCIHQCLEQFDCRDQEGNIDRKKLGAIIFNNQEKQKALEAIVHPYVFKKMKEALPKDAKTICFLDVPLLYESNMDTWCDEIWVVYCCLDVQLKRLMERNSLTKEEAMSRIHSQMDLEIKKEKATHLIDNNGDYDQTLKQVDQLLERLKEK